jgi:hypothetical protein
MYRSTSYASEKGRTVFIDMAEASAETARLLREARAVQAAEPPKQTPSLARRVVSTTSDLLDALRKRIAQPAIEARS